jgi:pilus assembly protein TadC
MESNLLHIIGFISILFYLGNMIADFCIERPLSAHIGYGLICIVTSYYINQILGLTISFVFVVYSLLILTIYVESIKSKRHA